LDSNPGSTCTVKAVLGKIFIKMHNNILLSQSFLRIMDRSKCFISQAWWLMPANLATREAEIRENTV
jgi:hypothetical protein